MFIPRSKTSYPGRKFHTRREAPTPGPKSFTRVQQRYQFVRVLAGELLEDGLEVVVGEAPDLVSAVAVAAEAGHGGGLARSQ
jgi:hypothetical protein